MGYDEVSKKYTMRAPSNLQEAAFIIAALGPAVRTLLDKLAEAHGNKAGPWLDEIEKIIITEAKGTISEDIPIETEASGMGLGIESLNALIQSLRRRLIVEVK
jgi:hypothetical protein